MILKIGYGRRQGSRHKLAMVESRDELPKKCSESTTFVIPTGYGFGYSQVRDSMHSQGVLGGGCGNQSNLLTGLAS